MKRLITAALLVPLGAVSILWALGYHGEREFRDAGALPPIAAVVEQARSLTGSPYDPWMGGRDNLGADLGFIVCSDVPNIAYGLAGYSLRDALKRDFERRPAAYNSADGNTPDNPYFHRRSRNLYAYFKANQRLLPATATPRVGDLAFYRGRSKNYISHVALVTEVSDDGYTLMESAPKTIFAQEVSSESVAERQWRHAGFGRMYPDVAR